MAQRDSNREVTYNVEKHIGILSTSSGGWTKELNMVAWNDKKAKYDLRDWNGDHTKMSRGITLSEEEMAALVALMKGEEAVHGGIPADNGQSAGSSAALF